MAADLELSAAHADRSGQIGEISHGKGVIYRYNLLKGAELAGPFDESVKLLHRGLDQFFGPDGDYGRIERYFKCLAFHPRESPPLADGEAKT